MKWLKNLMWQRRSGARIAPREESCIPTVVKWYAITEPESSVTSVQVPALHNPSVLANRWMLSHSITHAKCIRCPNGTGDMDLHQKGRRWDHNGDNYSYEVKICYECVAEITTYRLEIGVEQWA